MFELRVRIPNQKAYIIPLKGKNTQECVKEVQEMGIIPKDARFSGGVCPLWYLSGSNTFPILSIRHKTPTPQDDLETFIIKNAKELEKLAKALKREKRREKIQETLAYQRSDSRVYYGSQKRR